MRKMVKEPHFLQFTEIHSRITSLSKLLSKGGLCVYVVVERGRKATTPCKAVFGIISSLFISSKNLAEVLFGFK